jgi:lipopolysaccharide transport system ATP-binding protein
MVDPIVVQKVGKRYARYDPNRPWTIEEAFLRGFRELLPRQQFWGVRNVSFNVPRGHALGVIGRNGAGKSTLLRLLGGVAKPDEGRVRIQGRLSGLLALGAGFHTDLTGRENVFVDGVVAGLTRREVMRRFDSIVEFAELRDFIDSPLRTYSSGMQMRLAFSVAIHTEPDVLLVDEVLAVGDAAFQRKCLDRIAYFKRSGCAIVLVSHDVGLVREICDQALFLRSGVVAASGTAASVTEAYLSAIGVPECDKPAGEIEWASALASNGQENWPPTG